MKLWVSSQNVFQCMLLVSRNAHPPLHGAGISYASLCGTQRAAAAETGSKNRQRTFHQCQWSQNPHHEQLLIPLTCLLRHAIWHISILHVVLRRLITNQGKVDVHLSSIILFLQFSRLLKPSPRIETKCERKNTKALCSE